MNEPATGGDGDGDDAAAVALTRIEEREGGSTWAPEAWSKSPEAMCSEAAAINRACHAHAAAHATKHDNPPAYTHLRPF